jgi:mevalonate kinase
LSSSKPSFEVVVPGKWILAGEHSVLRGSEALVFPLKSKYLKLIYTKKSAELELVIQGEKKAELELIIWSVIEKALMN